MIDKLSNFRVVASKKTEGWSLYHRNLVLLMDLAMGIEDYSLVLDLGEKLTEFVFLTLFSHSSRLRFVSHLKNAFVVTTFTQSGRDHKALFI